MSGCEHCEQRKGKRSCPALVGMICSRCCGQHRLVEINRPADCVHLGRLAIIRDPERAGSFSQADYLAVWGKLRSYAPVARDLCREITERAGSGAPWDASVAAAYIHHGHRGADGIRIIDRFVGARGRDLSAGEAAAAIALQRARASLFEIVAARAGVGLDLRDLRTDETVHVRDVTGSAHLRERDVMFAWVMAFPDHLELTGAGCIVQRIHVEHVRAAIETELALARTRWPAIAEADLVGSIAWVVADALHDVSLEHNPVDEARARSSSRDDSGDRNDLDAGFCDDANAAPDPEQWLGLDESVKIRAIEAHHAELAIDLPNPTMHATLHVAVENQLAANTPPETRATLERLSAAGVARHAAVHAIGSVVAEALWEMLRHETFHDREAMIGALAALDPSDWRDGEPSSPSLAVIPPLGHELVYRRVHGFRAAIESAVRAMRRDGWTESMIFAPPQLLERSTIGEFLFRYAATLVVEGWERQTAIADADLLSIHAFSILTFEFHRKKTFWVDESLAFMLAYTRLDVRGEGFRLPFKGFALVFTDRETLALGEAVAKLDPHATVSGLPLRGLTVYVTQLPTKRGAIGLHLAFMLDADTDTWPWLITRDLEIEPEHTLDEIIESRFADSQNPDPIFRSIEMRKLVQLVVNAILFAGSSPAWPVVGAPHSRSEHMPVAKARGRPPLPPQRERPDRTEEHVWHLPGKIPIRQVRALRELQRDRQSGTLFSPSWSAVTGAVLLTPGTTATRAGSRPTGRARHSATSSSATTRSSHERARATCSSSRDLHRGPR